MDMAEVKRMIEALNSETVEHLEPPTTVKDGTYSYEAWNRIRDRLADLNSRLTSMEELERALALFLGRIAEEMDSLRNTRNEMIRTDTRTLMRGGVPFVADLAGLSPTRVYQIITVEEPARTSVKRPKRVKVQRQTGVKKITYERN